MRKIFTLSALAMAATALLTCCTKENAVSTGTFTVTAGTESTKTTNSDMSTLWAEDDAINIYHAAAGSTEYTSDGKFTLSAGAGTKTGSFTTTSEVSVSGTCDFYALYPYSSSKKSPVAGTSGWINIGNKTITSAGYGDKSVLAGANCPLYGIANGVTEGSSPAFSMKNLTSAIKFKIVNGTGKTLTVDAIKVEASTDIAGTYYVDITSDTPTYTASGAAYVSSSVTETVTGATEITAGGEAFLYMPIKPYVESGSIKVTVTGKCGGEDGNAEVTLTPSTEAKGTFTAGKIKTLTVNVTEMSKPSYDTVEDVFDGTAGNTYTLNDVLVTLVYSKGYFVEDATGTLLVYANATPTVKKGQKIRVSGTSATYGGMTQLASPSVMATLSEDNPVSLTPSAYDAAKVITAATSATREYVSLTALFTSTKAAKVTGAESNPLTVWLASDPKTEVTANKTYAVTGYIYGCSGSKAIIYVDSAVEQAVANLSATPTSLSYNAVGCSAKTVTVASDNDGWTYESSESWLTVTRDGDKLSAIPSDNTGAERTATITITHSNGTLTATVSVTQAAAGVSKTYTKVTSAPADWSGTYVLVYETTVEEKDVAYVWTGADVVNCYTTATPSSGTITLNGECSLTIAKQGDGYSIKVNGGDNDGKYISHSTNSNGLGISNTAASMTISIDSGSCIIKNEGGAVMRFNSASNQMRFRYYKTTSYASQKAVQLYKQN